MVKYALFRRTHEVAPVLKEDIDSGVKNFYMGDYLLGIEPSASKSAVFFNSPTGIYTKKMQFALLFNSKEQVEKIAKMLAIFPANYEIQCMDVSNGKTAYMVKLKRENNTYYLGENMALTLEQDKGLIFPSRNNAQINIMQEKLDKNDRFDTVEIIEIDFPQTFFTRTIDNTERALTVDSSNVENKDDGALTREEIDDLLDATNPSDSNQNKKPENTEETAVEPDHAIKMPYQEDAR